MAARLDRSISSIAVRVFAGVVGGYYFSIGLTTFGAAVATAGFKISRADAVMAASMLSFVVYLIVVLWVFAERRLARVCAILGGGAGLLFVAAHGLTGLS
jgi:hypothetical protein